MKKNRRSKYYYKYRSAKTGRFVRKLWAEIHPAISVRERYRR